MIFRWTKVVLVACVFLNGFFQIIVFAQTFDSDFSKEEQQRGEIRERQGQERSGYVYDTLEMEKQLIFQQLEIITGDEETRYIIVHGDTLTVSYQDRSERKGAVYKVSGQGEIHVPLIGAVMVGGLNRMKARALIDQKFREYIRHPKVDISVNTSGRIMVLGEVGRPGLYLMQPSLTVMEAVLKADSYNEDSANLKSVILIRGGIDNPIVKRLNLWKMIKKGDRSDDLLVKPGDLVFVPRRFIADLNRFKDNVYQWVSTYYGFGRLPAPPIVEKDQPLLYR